MTETHELDCHPASPSERLKLFENVFDVWPHAERLEEHLAIRVASPQHNRADWFVGCSGNQVAASLGCYPMQFHLRGRIVKGIAIGAVHTLPEYRGKGFAPRLMSWVEKYQAKRGAEISLLFSDIDPQYYARLGYQRCPAWEGWIDPNESPAAGLSTVRLAEFSPRSELNELMRAYDEQHSHRAFSISRDEAYWNYLLNKAHSHQHYWVIDRNQRRKGYASVAQREREWALQDWAIDEVHTAEVIALLLVAAREREIERVGGWCPETPAFQSIFRLTPRQEEVTMLKFLDGKQKADRDIQTAAGFICEIDHV